MKFTHLQRKTVSLIVLAAFVGLLHGWSMPAQAATKAGNSETTIAQGDSGPNFIEAESGKTPAISKGKKFPWLFVGLGVVVIGVALYFLVIKKTNYTLNVTLGAGCTGTPAATATYEKGTVVSYNYTPQAGFGLVKVTVDGVAAPAAGTITMDKDKTLAVTATAMDIRGTWLVTATGLTAASFHITFTGTTTSGTLKLVEFTNTGSYTVNGENISFGIGGGITFTGKFTTSTNMNGTHTYGNWSAVKGAASTSIPAVPQAIGPLKTK